MGEAQMAITAIATAVCPDTWPFTIRHWAAEESGRHGANDVDAGDLGKYKALTPLSLRLDNDCDDCDDCDEC